MPRLVHRTPQYRLHRASGQAVVTLDGKDYYLGRHGTALSHREYDRLVGEWLASGRQAPRPQCEVTVVEVVAAFWGYAKTYYRRPDGTPTREATNIREALRPVKELYGQTLAGDFGPLALKAVRERIIQLGWCRSTINKHVGRVKRAFRWAAAEELVPSSIHEALRTVDGLKAGRSQARESSPVSPASEAMVAAVLPFVAPPVKAMIELQVLTGMRSGEVCGMRGSDLTTSGPLWVYKPARHKMLHEGHDRTIFLGERAQQIIAPFLKSDPSAWFFSPADSQQWHRDRRHDLRKTPGSCGNGVGTNRKVRPKTKAGARYTPDSYGRAINYGCARAFPPPVELREAVGEAAKAKLAEWRKDHRWHPHQLRHSAATRLRRDFGLEVAQVILGHKTLTVTQVYAAKNVDAAQKVMAAVG